MCARCFAGGLFFLRWLAVRWLAAAVRGKSVVAIYIFPGARVEFLSVGLAALHQPFPMMRNAFLAADAILRGQSEPTRERSRLGTLLLILIFGSCYGALMGTFGGITGERLFQIVYSALKVPLLLLVTFSVALPSFFVLNTLLGVRSDFPMVLNALISTQAGLTIVLLSLAPYTLFWYASSADYNAAILFNALLFGISAFAGQWLLRRRYRRLIAANPRHRTLLRTWLVIYAFVGIQMGWVLRPFIGNPGMKVQFFREEAWGNAYVEVARKVHELFR